MPTLHKSQPHSVPQFPLLSNGDNGPDPQRYWNQWIWANDADLLWDLLMKYPMVELGIIIISVSPASKIRPCKEVYTGLTLCIWAVPWNSGVKLKLVPLGLGPKSLINKQRKILFIVIVILIGKTDLFCQYKLDIWVHIVTFTCTFGFAKCTTQNVNFNTIIILIPSSAHCFSWAGLPVWQRQRGKRCFLKRF